MKKKYEKPGFYVENFALSQSIAAACEGISPESTTGRPLQGEPSLCAWKVDENVAYWTENGLNCIIPLDPNFQIEVPCYNGPQPGLYAFATS